MAVREEIIRGGFVKVSVVSEHVVEQGDGPEAFHGSAIIESAGIPGRVSVIARAADAVVKTVVLFLVGLARQRNLLGDHFDGGSGWGRLSLVLE